MPLGIMKDVVLKMAKPLTGEDLLAICKAYKSTDENKYSAVPDVSIVKYNELKVLVEDSTTADIDSVLNGHRYAFVLYEANSKDDTKEDKTSSTEQSIGHWTAIIKVRNNTAFSVKTRNNNTNAKKQEGIATVVTKSRLDDMLNESKGVKERWHLEFMDPYGLKIDTEIEDDKKRWLSVLVRRAIDAEKYSFVVSNTAKLQTNNDKIATCGRWAAYRAALSMSMTLGEFQARFGCVDRTSSSDFVQSNAQRDVEKIIKDDMNPPEKRIERDWLITSLTFFV
jgi:hypothetical protein